MREKRSRTHSGHQAWELSFWSASEEEEAAEDARAQGSVKGREQSDAHLKGSESPRKIASGSKSSISVGRRMSAMGYASSGEVAEGLQGGRSSREETISEDACSWANISACSRRICLISSASATSLSAKAP